MYETTGFASQLSVAVKIAASGTALHSTVTSIGTSLKIGAVVSWIFIVWLAVVLFPHASVTVQVLEIILFPAHSLAGFIQTLLNLMLPFTLACFLEKINQVPFIKPVRFSKLETKEVKPVIVFVEVVAPFGVKFRLTPSWILLLLFHCVYPELFG